MIGLVRTNEIGVGQLAAGTTPILSRVPSLIK
jgi:hypothetical protein